MFEEYVDVVKLKSVLDELVSDVGVHIGMDGIPCCKYCYSKEEPGANNTFMHDADCLYLRAKDLKQQLNSFNEINK